MPLLKEQIFKNYNIDDDLQYMEDWMKILSTKKKCFKMNIKNLINKLLLLINAKKKKVKI